jgi:hypothetical protein
MALPEHFAAPYPTREERRALATEGGISEAQVVYWFSNTRKRSWKVGLGVGAVLLLRRCHALTSSNARRTRSQ